MRIVFRFTACLFLMLSVLIFLSPPGPVTAEGLSLSVLPSSDATTVGKTITVTVKLKATITLENYDAVIQYNTDCFTYVGGSAKNLAANLTSFGANAISASSIKIAAYGGSQANASSLFQLSFKAIKKGTAVFSVSEANVNDEYPPSASVSVTVTEPVVLPGINTLKALDVDPGNLTPAFSSNQTEYAVTVAEGVGKLTVSAVPTDGKATVKVSGNTDLQDGANQITIVVTAQNGDKKTYTILATRAGPTPTPSPSPTPEPTPTPAVSVSLPDGFYAVLEAPDDVPVPDGFYLSTIDLNGQTVPVYKAVHGELILFYLVGPSSGFFYFDSSAGQYVAFTVLTLPAQSFTVLLPEDSAVIPAGWQAAVLLFKGQEIPAWRQSDGSGDSGDYLLYLQNGRGDKAFYLFNQTNQLLSLFRDMPAVTETSATLETTAVPTPTPTPPADDSDGSEPNPWTLTTALLGLLCLILTGLLIWQGVKASGRPAGDGPIRKPPIRRVD